MGYSIRADAEKIMDGRTKLHRGRYYMGRGFVVPGDVVLDFGCGQGYGSHILAETAKQVIGIDMVESDIEYHKEHKTLDNIDFKADNLEKMELPEIDVACGFEVLEHLYDPASFLTKLKAKAKKWIIVSVPIGETLTEVDGDIQIKGDSTHHFAFGTPQVLINMVIDDNWAEIMVFNVGVTCIAMFYNKGQYDK